MKPDFLKIETESSSEFDSIANHLMNDYAIENHESLFRLTEIEFYWNSPTHNDNSTYIRNHVNPENGDWFFHYSGVDIALKSQKLKGHGGILIRGIYCLEENKIYKGPMVCAMKLFSGTNAFSNSIKTKIVEHKFEQKEFFKTPRIGLGKNAEESGTNLLEYRYTIELK
jgi:hypothetical protein